MNSDVLHVIGFCFYGISPGSITHSGISLVQKPILQELKTVFNIDNNSGVKSATIVLYTIQIVSKLRHPDQRENNQI